MALFRNRKGLLRLTVVLLILAAFIVAGVIWLPVLGIEQPQGSGDWLNPYSPVGQQIATLYDVVYYIAVGVFVIVEGLLFYAIYRYRFRPGRERLIVPQVHGNTTLEITWTAIPALIVAGLVVLTFNTMTDIHDGPGNGPTSLNPAHRDQHAVAATLMGQAPAGALRVEAIGHQWWWEFRYPELGITTATMMHVPAGRAIEVFTTSKDVIHSWWVPQMTGKLDSVPGVMNATWFLAPAEAAIGQNIYHAQCAEFCGEQHAIMQFRVQVDTPEDFERWARQQVQPAPAINAELATRGQTLFATKGCVGCHALAGYPAQALAEAGLPPTAADPAPGKIGPDLTHVYSRPLIAGGALSLPLDNAQEARENMARWLRNPQEVKPGNLMASAIKPGVLTEEQVQALTEYLLTLR